MSDRPTPDQMRLWLSHPVTRYFAGRMRTIARETVRKQLDADPYTAADEIKRCQQLRHVLTVLLPHEIDRIVNFDEYAPDKRVEPKRQWKLAEWLRSFF